MITVKLTETLLLEGAQIGARRNARSIARGDRYSPGCDASNCWQAHCLGGIGERAFAHAMGILYENSIDTFEEPDVYVPGVGRIEVKTSITEGAHLIVYRRKLKAEQRYALVWGVGLVYHVIGWCWGTEADKHLRPNAQCWVPCNKLHPLNSADPKEWHL